MLMTPNWAARSGCSSTLTLPTLMSLRSAATSSTMGDSIRQGPHQLAQKSSRTGFSLCSTSASKFALVMVMGSISVTSLGSVLFDGISIPQNIPPFRNWVTQHKKRRPARLG